MKKESKATKVVVCLRNFPLHPNRILNIITCEKRKFEILDPGEKTLDQCGQLGRQEVFNSTYNIFNTC